MAHYQCDKGRGTNFVRFCTKMIARSDLGKPILVIRVDTGVHNYIWALKLVTQFQVREAVVKRECYNVGALLTECSWIPNVESGCSCYGFIHDNAVIKSMIAPHQSLFSRLFRRRSNKTSKLRVTGLCVGNSPGTGELPAQMASNAENISIWWRHHVIDVNWSRYYR